MIWQLIIAGFSLGMLSSFHCVGMCGPIVFSLPVKHLNNTNRFIAITLYHAGRITSYASLGLIFGLLGRNIYLAGFQRWFSIALGVLTLFVLAQYLIYKTQVQPGFLKKFYYSLNAFMGKRLRNPSPINFLLLGMANGLLPCGMVYMAIAAAASASSVSNAVLLMLMFGAGTLPTMYGLSYFGYLINLQIRNRIKKSIPLFIALMGILLILRGLNLGIPYISPVMQTAQSPAVICR